MIIRQFIKLCFFRFLLVTTTYITCITSVFAQSSTIINQYESAVQRYKVFESQHRRFMSTQHVNLSYLEWGDVKQKEQVLIWLHGSLGNAYEFMPFADYFVQKGYRVISVDQYRHGKTQLPSFDASFADFATDLSGLLDSLGISKAVVGGFSRGAYIATEFYNTYPSYVKALVLEDGGSVALQKVYFKLDSIDLARTLKEIELPPDLQDIYYGCYPTEFAAYASLYDHENTSDQFEILSFVSIQDDQWITYRGLDDYYQMKDSLQVAQLLFSPDKLSRYASSIVRVQPHEVFRNLKVPVLILDAVIDDDAMPVEIENAMLANDHPQFIKHLVFEEANHNIHYYCPDRFVREIWSFLSHL